MTNKLFVVLGENGEYSDRDVWVSAVYPTREEAEKAVLENLAKRRENELWDERYRSALPPEHITYRYTPPTNEEREAARAAALEVVGPEPPYSRAERAEIFEVEVGRWYEGVEWAGPYSRP